MPDFYNVCLTVCFAVCALMTGCHRGPSNAPDLRVDLRLDPSPPVVGDASAILQLRNAEGTPLQGAKVRLEGNMNHAGMKPSFAELREVTPGEYSGKLNFTMGGDWFILATVETTDGQTVEHKIDVPGVRAE